MEFFGRPRDLAYQIKVIKNSTQTLISMWLMAGLIGKASQVFMKSSFVLFQHLPSVASAHPHPQSPRPPRTLKLEPVSRHGGHMHYCSRL